MKKSFNQMKKDLHVGVKVKTIHNFIKPEKDGAVREIAKVQTNAIAFKDNTPSGLSWLWFAKAGNYEYEDNIIKVYDDPASYNNYQRTLVFEYEIIA